MSTRASFARQPQSVWVRRALFQLHLWTGIGFGLYVFVVCLSGSAIVLRRELDKALCPRTILVKPVGPRMTDAQLAAAALAAFPRMRLRPAIEVRGPRVPGAAVEVWYLFGRGRFERLFDPYTGKDLGDTVACEPTFVSWIADLHDDLLGGDTGQLVNGAGAVLLTLMCATGAILWWPGVGRWRRSMTLRRNTNWRRFNWDLHSVLGFWMFLLIVMWAVSGIYLAFPGVFYAAGNFLAAHGAGPATGHRLDVLIDWMVRLHFGRSFGLFVKGLWVILGLVPCGLFVTGALMWWNRVLRRSIGRSGEPAPPAREDKGGPSGPVNSPAPDSRAAAGLPAS
ncbi:MAG TPA: PepSY-associated TM helix domain-containing protein [Steroidobacteraceae bacterium]|jgi:uncharacterized iron-regulated membrane protein|nr:PepSY-associated TM helix domain-containing protein [Steroidobacteraceae bacterium]